MTQINRFLLNSYIIFSPFMTWLALTGWLRLPVAIILVCVAISLPFFLHTLVAKPKSIIKSEEDWLLIAMLGFIFISFFSSSMETKKFNHVLAFIFVFCIYNIFFKYALLRYNFSIKHIFKMVFITAIIANSIVIIEWGLLNGFNIIIRKIFILSENTYTMIYYPFLFFKSVGGTCEEPSTMAFNMNIIFPIGLYYVYTEQKKWTWAYVILYVVALFFTASAGGVGFIIFAYIVSGILEASPKYILKLLGNITIACIAGYVIYLFLPDDLQYVFDKFTLTITSKIALNADSADMRTTAWTHAINDWLDSPWFGKGPGYGNEAYFGFGYQNAYLKILAETGIFSLLMFLAFLGIIFFKILKIKQPLRRFLMIGFLAGTPHLFLAETYYHVCLWILIILVQLIHYQESKTVVHE